LNNAVKDIHDMTSALTSRYNFEEENLTLITDSAATKNNIINELRNLIEKVGPNDNLVVIYSGHGYFDELLNEGYWIPMDAKKNSFGDYIANQTLLNILKNIQSQHIFLVADACFSGSLLASSGRGYTESVEKYKSRWCLASGRLEVVSDGQLGANSPFAKTLIDYLNDNEKEALAVSELVTDVKIKVAEQASQTPIGSPLKNIGDEGGEFIFRLKQD
jgi:hypothetical protein